MMEETINKLNELQLESGEYVSAEEVVKVLKDAINNLSNDTYIVEKLGQSLEKDRIEKLVNDINEYVELTKIDADEKEVSLPSGEVVSTSLIKEAIERYQQEIIEEMKLRENIEKKLSNQINQINNKKYANKEIEQIAKEIQENEKILKENSGNLAEFQLKKVNYQISKNQALVDKYNREIEQIANMNKKISEYNNPILNSSPISLAFESVLTEVKSELQKLINELLEKNKSVEEIKQDKDYINLSRVYSELFNTYKVIDDKFKNRKINISSKDNSLNDYFKSLGISNELIDRFMDKINNYKEITSNDKDMLWNEIVKSFPKGSNLDKSILEVAKKIFDDDMKKIIYLQVKKSLDNKKQITADKQESLNPSPTPDDVDNDTLDETIPQPDESNNLEEELKNNKKYDDSMQQALYEVCIYNNIPEEKAEELLDNIITKGKVQFNDGTLYQNLKKYNKSQNMMQMSTAFQQINNLGLIIKRNQKRNKKIQKVEQKQEKIANQKGIIKKIKNAKLSYDITSEIRNISNRNERFFKEIDNRNIKIVDGKYVNKTDEKVNEFKKEFKNNEKAENDKITLKDITIGDTVYLNRNGNFYENSYFVSENKNEKEPLIKIPTGAINVYGDIVDGLDIMSFPVKYISIYNNKTGNQIQIADQGTSLNNVVKLDNIDLRNSTIRFAVELPGEKYMWVDYNSNNYQIADLYNKVINEERNR